MRQLIIATKNKDKLKEMRVAFKNLPFEIVSLDRFGALPDAVEDGKTFADNALIKAKFFMELTGRACIADDSGLCVDALDGMPGVYSARYASLRSTVDLDHAHDSTDGDNNRMLLDELDRIGVEQSSAAYKCALCFVDTDGTVVETEGKCRGTIKKIPRGTGGFGYDPYFYTDADKTMAELTLEQKDRISHRGEALRKMVEILEGKF
ncbi:MAG: RdgB/HAM1 family non-canonical purine NTP pyrophosphatase [Selenomonadaceae bacterium]|nr:RdgB/HAM1 family non-canonical purine NTP pyrophosphatase [Selenomonadaceae bacterium]